MKIDKAQKIIISLVLIVAIIFVPVYFYVLADDNDRNKIEVTNSVVKKMDDGSLPFDSTSGAGNDTGINNGVVRTFDSVTYTLNYYLEAKEGETIDTSTNDRKVILDVLLPSNVTANVSLGANSEVTNLIGEVAVTPSSCDYSEGNIVFNGAYRYAEFVIDNQGVNDVIPLNVYISDIYAANDTNFEPIFAIKEYTDEDKKSIEEFNCSELAGDFNNVRDQLNIINACENDINGDTSCSVNVSGKQFYSIKLFSGDYNVEDTSSSVKTYPVGVLVTLDNQVINGNENKGIKGMIVPSNVDVRFTITDNGNPINVTLSDYKTYTSYANQNPQEYKVYLDRDNSIEFEELHNGDVTNENNVMKISGIKNIRKSASGYYYVSSNVFFVSYERASYDYSSKAITITSDGGGEVVYNNNYDFTLGDYSSRIELYNTLNSDKEAYGQANFNYNQDFYIKEVFNYGGSGDGITNLNNYLKIDNSAIDIIINDQNLDYNFEMEKGSLDTIRFGYGEWNENYFELTFAEGCPSSFDDLSKENLMNLYGGPCIREKEGMVKWVEHIDDESLGSMYKQFGPMLVSTVVTGDETKNNLILSGAEATLILKAKVKDNSRLNNNSYQIVTNAYAYANGTKTNLGKSGFDIEGLLKNPNNFSKTEISTDGLVINRNACLADSCPIFGNSILVSGVKVSKPSISYYRNGKETSNFYYYPIEMRISSSAIKNDTEAVFEKADIYVDLPTYMEYIDYDNSPTAKSPIEVTDITINDKAYKRYHYEFGKYEINNGEINDLKVFSNISMDTENGVMPTIYVTSDFTISKEVSGSNNEKTTVYMSSIMPSSYRSIGDISITLYNGSNVTTQGNTTPSNIEKNGSYTYSMKAYNNSRNNGNSLSYPNASLYYVVPYKGDSSYTDLSSKFEATGFKIKLNSELPSGYTAYYTEDLASNIINEEIGSSNTITWNEWTNPTTEKANITGIKIKKTTNFEPDTYFVANNGISITVTPIGSEEGDIYYNVFYIITDKPSNYECLEGDTSCGLSDSKKLYYSSSRTLTSIYNRKVSGFVFEDYNENGLYSDDESRLENIPVSLYRIKGDISNADPNDPTTFVSENDELIAETTTGSNGEYTFRGISKGNYYVKYIYDNNKYVPTENNVIDPSISGSSAINSKASALVNTDIAISNIITFGGKTTEFNDYNLGLKIKKEFAVDIKKFITNAQIISDDKIENFDYQNATTVTLNVRNPKNSKLRVTYSFYVENTKYYPGYVGMVVDAIPEGMTFNPNLIENKDWILVDNYVYYNGLTGKILLPNEKQTFKLVLEADLATGGTYINSVSVKDLVLMGDELPSYDFNSLNILEGGE